MGASISRRLALGAFVCVAMALLGSGELLAQNAWGPVPANKNYSGNVTLTRAGQNFVYHWNLKFGSASRQLKP